MSPFPHGAHREPCRFDAELLRNPYVVWRAGSPWAEPGEVYRWTGLVLGPGETFAWIRPDGVPVCLLARCCTGELHWSMPAFEADGSYASLEELAAATVAVAERAGSPPPVYLWPEWSRD